jgi:DNA helicase-2/ATP-dependent DNA helicase PcrA
MSSLLSGLNPEQHQAVVHGSGPLLVLAGAGSGKTRVITHRIAYLIERGVKPWQIIAVTFTNKAAGEMLDRVRALAGEAASDAWVSTFHAAGVRILRRDGYKIGLPRQFTILDDSDQLTAMKRVLKDLNIDDDLLKARDALNRVDHFKNLGVSPEEVEVLEDDVRAEAIQRAYRRYEDSLKAQGAVDFGDLLLRVVELFKASEDTRAYYQRRFVHVLVDEFQDTNPVQYQLLQLLSPDKKNQANLCVVGDDDQSIYRWRGADVGNILKFSKDFPGTTTVKLERNYRSTPRILEAAHGVIANNARRAPKKLWTEGEPGEKLQIVVASDDRGEALAVADRISRLRAIGTKYSDIAVFYRSNAQSRVLEEALRSAQVPYAIVRGLSFYDRVEIRDIASYLRLIVNPRSDNDFIRAVGSPPRGIGDTTLDRLGKYASSRGISLWEAVVDVDKVDGINAGLRTRLKAFWDQIAEITLAVAAAPAGEAVEAVARKTGFLERLQFDPRGEGEERVQNVKELIRAAREFDLTWQQVVNNPARPFEELPEDAIPRPGVVAPEATALAGFGRARYSALQALRGDADQPAPTALEAFLGQVAMLGDADNGGEPDRVSLMTLHAAKGLEFNAIFMTGMEDSIFPTARAIDEDDDAIEEERRLCYVGLTRARQRVYLTLARARTLYGNYQENPPSMFLREIPPAVLEGLNQLMRVVPAQASPQLWGGPSLRPRPRENRDDGTYVEREDELSYSDDGPREYRRPPPLQPPRHAAASPGIGLGRGSAPSNGTRVRHKQFGEGKVLAAQGAGPTAKLTVNFGTVGPKVVVAQYVEVLD